MNRLFEPIQIGNLELNNRIIFPPMSTAFEQQGKITDTSINFYTTIAQGGASLIILGDATVDPGMGATPDISDDSFIPMLRQLTESVHACDAKISPQIFHQEFYVSEIMSLPQEQVRAKIEDDTANFANRLTLEQIEACQEKFSDAARRAIEAGFDMIQVHGDRLVGQFCSPVLNKRTDHYGGSLENRARFVLEVMKRVKEVVGDRVPIDYKLSIIRPNEGKAGPTLDEAKIMAPWLVETGVDSFHVSLANHTGVHQVIPPMGSKPIGCFVDLAEAIKKVVNVPVAAVGRIVDPKFAEAIIVDGKADLVSLCRGLVADPEWPLKAQEGRYDDIRKCIMCNQGCTDRLLNRQSISCSINATVGKEVSSRITKAETAKDVLVIGGGPAGMEAARVAALRGHKVTLMEKADRLGGQLNLATIPPHKEEMNQITEYLPTQIEKLGVNIKLNEEATPAAIEGLKPDEVIVATGATPLIPDIPGVQGENVTNAWDVLAGKSTTGQRVIVVGGGSVGSETAEFLAESGKAVTIVEMLDKICIDMSPTIVPFFMERIKPYRLKVFTQHKLLEINDKGVITMDDQQQRQLIEADTVVMAIGAQSNNELVKDLQEKGIKVHAIGDCSQEGPRKLFDAVHEGYFTALKI